MTEMNYNRRAVKNFFSLIGKQILPSIVIMMIYSCASKPAIINVNRAKDDSISNSKNASAVVIEYPQDDLEYNPLLLKWQRDVTLYKNFEMYFSGNATLMTFEMLEAYKKRFIKIQGQNARLDENIVPQNRDVLSIVMTAYTSVPKFNDFEDNKLWNKSLFYNNKWIEPSSISYYRNSNPLAAFFPVGSIWSKIYVLQFHVPNFDEEQVAQDGTHLVQLSLHSAMAKADYYWRWCGKFVENCK